MENNSSTTTDDVLCHSYLPCSGSITSDIFLQVVYASLLGIGSRLIAQGSEYLLEIASPGIIGGLVLPLLGSLPDAAIILVSCLGGTPVEIQHKVTVGIGSLSGSNTFLITIPWVVSAFVGKCDISQVTGTAKNKTYTGWSWSKTGISVMNYTTILCRMMIASLFPYFIITLAFIISQIRGESIQQREKYWALSTSIICFLGFIAYSCYQMYDVRYQERKLNLARKKFLWDQFCKHVQIQVKSRMKYRSIERTFSLPSVKKNLPKSQDDQQIPHPKPPLSPTISNNNNNDTQQVNELQLKDLENNNNNNIDNNNNNNSIDNNNDINSIIDIDVPNLTSSHTIGPFSQHQQQQLQQYLQQQKLHQQQQLQQTKQNTDDQIKEPSEPSQQDHDLGQDRPIQLNRSECLHDKKMKRMLSREYANASGQNLPLHSSFPRRIRDSVHIPPPPTPVQDSSSSSTNSMKHSIDGLNYSSYHSRHHDIPSHQLFQGLRDKINDLDEDEIMMMSFPSNQHPQMDITIDAFSKDQQPKKKDVRTIIIKAVLVLILGTTLTFLFADAFVESITQFSQRVGIPPFYISFIIAPFALNSSELVAAYVLCQKKKRKNISLVHSSLYGAVTMNNLIALGILLFMIYYRGLIWNFSAETLVIFIVTLTVGAMGSLKTTFTMIHAVAIGSLFPVSIIIIAVLESSNTLSCNRLSDVLEEMASIRL
ncbi:hypothetical protein DFA_00160 [Cavenderia fasciculata]|uniref:Sodium/calcium exchanger membrane region domain-containing protein n=1 Tax=Cavenderia fasciculata TaxID=261658 RepID=F4PXS2_CACFS|nr:uncharacterized protein DFA_00160 [Cavenderia fasciculata]EGG19582.1 hypothetical protein DFA_00160 [Cavenderia fasciculata]|eukprot:XP_004357876.1 hypothetical protein DFA_00160 [Cavenderia fasciculata]